MTGVLLELRRSLRLHLHRPGLALTVVLSLSLAIAAVTAVFQLVYGAMLRPLPFPQADRIVDLTMTRPEEGTEGGRVSFADYRDWREQSRSFSHLAAISEESLVLTGAGNAERIVAARVSAELFPVFGLAPVLGSVPAEEWRRPGARLAIVSESFWRERYAGDRDLLGRSIRLDDVPFTVVAVMPEALDLPRQAALWIPLDPTDPSTAAEVRAARFLRVVGRLADHATLEGAGRELHAISRALEEAHPETNADQLAVLVPLRERLYGDLRLGLLLLSVAVVCVLLIVCGNVAAVLLALGAERGGDLRVRLAHGATPGRIGVVLLLENFVLTLVGTGLGLALGTVVGGLLAALSPRTVEVVAGFDLQVVLVLFALGLAAFTGFLVTLPCALQAAHHGRSSAAGRGTVGGDRFTTRFQSLLLIVQLAVAVALLVVSGLMLRSTVRLLSVDVGFRTAGIVTCRVMLPDAHYPEASRKATFLGRLLEELRGHPGVLSAAAVTNLPLSGSNMTFGVSPAEAVDQAADLPTTTHYRAVSPGYFRTLGVPIVEGRDIGRGDVAGAPPVIVVNEAFARALFPDRLAVGRRIRLTFGDGEPRRIVGVVGDLRHFELARAPEPEVYVPYAQQPWPFMTLVVHGRRAPEQMVAQVRSALAAVDPDLPIDRIATMAELVNASVARPRFYGVLLGAFALLALSTAGVGVYGLTAYWVSQRRDEIGLRLALGATRSTIRRHLLHRPLILALLGIALGTCLALLAGRVFESMLYGVSPDDPLVLTATAIGLLLAVLLAAWLPARRATRLDPALVLRRE